MKTTALLVPYILSPFLKKQSPEFESQPSIDFMNGDYKFERNEFCEKSNAIV